MFEQLSNRESLRDLIVALDATIPNVIIWEWGGMFQAHPWHEPIKTEIIKSEESLLFISESIWDMSVRSLITKAMLRKLWTIDKKTKFKRTF